MGGLLACYASAAYPTKFKRALCMSPSAWWNAGEIASLIKMKLNESGSILPKSVVIEVGTAEGLALYMKDGNLYTWIDFIDQMKAAWVSVGLGITDEASKKNKAYPSSTSNLFWFTVAGGMHVNLNWNEIFSYGTSLLYQYDFPSIYKVQRNSLTSWEYPSTVNPVSSTCDDSNDVNSQYEISLIFLSVYSFLTTMAISYVAYKYYITKPPMSSNVDQSHL
jgi:hypothetical protein